MLRRVEPELLDALPPDDPRALRSRKDLLRINAWMGNPGIMANELRSVFNGEFPRSIVDIGAGDGAFMLRVAHDLAALSNGSSLCLLDRQTAVSQQTLGDLKTLGWQVLLLQSDVLDWLKQPATEPSDVIIANLFLHHFPDAQLAELLAAAAKRTRVFIAVEPRRWSWSLAFSRLVGLIGCNAVTRHDAVVSVRAGFCDRELSRRWPADASWLLEERPANWCSHLFIAKRARS
jgi:SAM-dependent methyltransferase